MNKKDTVAQGAASGGHRRRIGQIVHDERGTASLEWRDAPEGYERPVLRVEGTGVKSPEALAIQKDDSFNPYNRVPEPSPGPSAGKGGKRDLRKLSAWMKMMRELETRKKNGED